ncbi:MAG: hypothetical protein ACLS67_15260 [Anaerobutyricum soehngenii]
MGQRSQIYVRFNKENGQSGLIANYYGWNFGERMISRARWGIECIKEHFEYISNSCQQTPFGMARNISSDLRCDGIYKKQYNILQQQVI